MTSQHELERLFTALWEEVTDRITTLSPPLRQGVVQGVHANGMISVSIEGDVAVDAYVAHIPGWTPAAGQLVALTKQNGWAIVHHAIAGPGGLPLTS